MMAGCAAVTEGEVDADGFLRITGRIKEMFKTSGGKYIVPPAIEAKFIALCPFASQFLCSARRGIFRVALIALDPDAIAGWAAEPIVGKAPTRSCSSCRRCRHWSTST